MNFYNGVYLVFLIHLKLRRIIKRKTITLTNHINLHENVRENSEFFAQIGIIERIFHSKVIK